MNTQILAWSKTTTPEGKLYAASELAADDLVKDLFKKCKNSEGYITAEGWEHLISSYGLGVLTHIDGDSGWFQQDENGGKKESLVFQSLLAGYNPVIKMKGDYEPETGIFINLEGMKCQFNWDEVAGLE